MRGASPLSPPAVRFMLFGSPGSEKRVNRIFFTGAAAPYAPDTFSGVPAGTAAPCLRTYDSLSKVGRNVNIPRHAFYYLGITTDRRSLRTVNARPSEKQGACGSDVIDVKRRADRSVPRGVLKAICARGAISRRAQLQICRLWLPCRYAADRKRRVIRYGGSGFYMFTAYGAAVRRSDRRSDRRSYHRSDRRSYHRTDRRSDYRSDRRSYRRSYRRLTVLRSSRTAA